MAGLSLVTAAAKGKKTQDAVNTYIDRQTGRQAGASGTTTGGAALVAAAASGKAAAEGMTSEQLAAARQSYNSAAYAEVAKAAKAEQRSGTRATAERLDSTRRAATAGAVSNALIRYDSATESGRAYAEQQERLAAKRAKLSASIGELTAKRKAVSEEYDERIAQAEANAPVGTSGDAPKSFSDALKDTFSFRDNGGEARRLKADKQAALDFYDLAILKASALSAEDYKEARHPAATTADDYSKVGRGYYRIQDISKVDRSKLNLPEDVYMTGEEYQVYSYYKSDGGKRTEYLRLLRTQLNDRQEQLLQDKAGMLKGKVYKTLAESESELIANAGVGLFKANTMFVAAVMGLIGGLEGAYNTVYTAVENMVTGAERRADTSANAAAIVAENATGTVTEGLPGWAQWLSQTAISIEQNALLIPLAMVTPGLSLAIMATSAGGQAADEAAERGASSGQALAYGIAAGINEAFWERFSLSGILDIIEQNGKTAATKYIASVVKQIVGEGGEEIATDLSNAIADGLIMGGESEYGKEMQEYIAGGKSADEAAQLAGRSLAVKALLSGLAGAISGGVLGGGNIVIGAEYLADNLAGNKVLTQDEAGAVILSGLDSADASIVAATKALINDTTSSSEQLAARLGAIYKALNQTGELMTADELIDGAGRYLSDTAGTTQSGASAMTADEITQAAQAAALEAKSAQGTQNAAGGAASGQFAARAAGATNIPAAASTPQTGAQAAYTASAGQAAVQTGAQARAAEATGGTVTTEPGSAGLYDSETAGRLSEMRGKLSSLEAERTKLYGGEANAEQSGLAKAVSGKVTQLYGVKTMDKLTKLGEKLSGLISKKEEISKNVDILSPNARLQEVNRQIDSLRAEMRGVIRSAEYRLKRGTEEGSREVTAEAPFTSGSESGIIKAENSTSGKEGLTNGKADQRSDEFRGIQEASRKLSREDVEGFHGGSKQLDEGIKENLAGVFRRELYSSRSGNSNDVRILTNKKTGEQFTIVNNIDGNMFHDVFEIVKNYLFSGDAVDLHTAQDYARCKNFLTSDGLSGFSIEEDGNLISVFNLGTKGFLSSISDYAKEQGADRLDCFDSKAQPLPGIYKKALGFKTASLLDFNYEMLAEDKGKEYADYFVRTYGEAPVAFMADISGDIDTRTFAEDQYDEAVAYRDSFLNSRNNSAGADEKSANADKKSENANEQADRERAKTRLDKGFEASLLKKSGYKIERVKSLGKTASGKTRNGKINFRTKTITLADDAADGGLFVAVHEVTHSLKSAENYLNFRKYVLNSKLFRNRVLNVVSEKLGREVTPEEVCTAMIAEANANGEKMTMEQAKDELLADFCGQYLFTDEAAIRQVTGGYRSIAERIRDAIARVKRWFSGGRLYRELLRAENMYRRMLGQETYGVRNKDEMFSTGKGLSAEKRFRGYDKPITPEDVKTVQSIGRKHISDFTQAEIDKTKKWAYKSYRELGAKSPFFTAWFGNWREHDTKGHSDVVKLGYGETLNNNGQKHFIVNDDTGFNIEISTDLDNDSMHYASINKDKPQTQQLLGKANDIVKNAILLDTSVSDKNNTHKKGSTQFMHYLYSIVTFNGNPFLAKLTVEEYGNETSRRAYNLKRLKMSELSRAQFSNIIKENREIYAYNSDAVSVAQLFSFVKQYDKDFRYNPVGSTELLNPDGTPKFVYHGTDYKFSVFKPSDGRREYFFTDSLDAARDYGGIQMKGYLDMKKPYVIDLKGEGDAAIYDAIDYAKANDYDGVIAKNAYDGANTHTEFVAFDENQFKSVDNIGTFSDSNDVYYSESQSDDYAALIKKYGAQKPRSTDETGTQTPKQSSDEKTVSLFAGNVETTKGLPERTRRQAQDVIVREGMSYVPYSNKAALNKVNDTLLSSGYEGALAEFHAAAQSGKFDVNTIALGEVLLREAASRGDSKETERLMVELAVTATNAGRAVQVFSMLKRLTPEGRIYLLRQTLKQLNKSVGGRKDATGSIAGARELIDTAENAESQEKTSRDAEKDRLDALKSEAQEIKAKLDELKAEAKDIRSDAKTESDLAQLNSKLYDARAARDAAWKRYTAAKEARVRVMAEINAELRAEGRFSRASKKYAEKTRELAAKAKAAQKKLDRARTAYYAAQEKYREQKKKLDSLTRRAETKERQAAAWRAKLREVNAEIPAAQKRYEDAAAAYKLARDTTKGVRELKAALARIGAEITIPQRIIDDIGSQTTVEGAELAYSRAVAELAAQVKVSPLDKLNAWRYMAMLLNPTTHIRNIAGNATMYAAAGVKDIIAATLEAPISGKSKSVTATLGIGSRAREALRFARADYEDAGKALTGKGEKTTAYNDIMDARKIFSAGVLEKLRKLSGGTLEAEDNWFLKASYIRSLAEYITANRLDTGAMTDEQLNRARALAAEEAIRNTYHDASKVAQTLNQLQRTKLGPVPAGDILIGGTLPFKATPINILKRGVEYSPLGIIKGTYQLAENGIELHKGDAAKYTAAEVVDSLASGLTGTGLVALGAWLAAAGILRGAFRDDPEDKLAKLRGEQEYSIQIGGESYTVDWLSPVTLPLFVGVEAYRSITEGGDTAGLSAILNAAAAITEPMFNMTMLQGINDLIGSVKFSDYPVTDIIGEAAVNYLLQGVPSVTGKLARIIDGTTRAYYIDKTTGVPELVQELIQGTAKKLPGATYTLNPYIDEWGETVTDSSLVSRIATNIVSPGYYSTIEDDPTEKELLRLYRETGSEDIIPDRAKKSITYSNVTYQLTAKEYVTYAQTRGQTAYSQITDFIESEAYSGLTDSEKAELIAKLYGYAECVAKKAVLPGYTTSEFEKVSGAVEEGLTAAEYYAFKSTASTDGNDTITQKEAKAAIDKIPGLSVEQKRYLYFSCNSEWKNCPYN